MWHPSFGDVKDHLMKDRNIYGANDSSMWRMMLKETDKFLQMARAAELSSKRIKTVSSVQNRDKLKEIQKQDRGRLYKNASVGLQGMY